VPTAVRRLVELVAEKPAGLTKRELLTLTQSRFPRLPHQRVADLVARALAAGALVENAGQLHAAHAGKPAGQPIPKATSASDRPLRAIAIDVESVVRATASEPYLDTRIFQIGAVRFGADEAWIAAAPRRSWWLDLPGQDWHIRSESLRERHSLNAVAPAVALLELHQYAAKVDVVVAYNGTQADFPLLTAAYQREDLPALTPTPVDAYYLALCL
jgi:ATP-dependent DNA helicase RecQ